LNDQGPMVAISSGLGLDASLYDRFAPSCGHPVLSKRHP